MNDEQQALEQGIDGVDPEKAQERADVKAWFKKFEAARKFDEAARKQYAIDRRYARGDSGFAVDANKAGTNIDILESFLFAKSPDIDVMPAIAVEPPDQDSLMEAARAAVMNDPQMAQAAQIALQTGVADPATIRQMQEVAIQQRADAMLLEIRQAYDKRNRDAKAYAETLEIVTSRMWRDANLKRRGRQLTRSALTVGIGWIKASWQERTGQSPTTVQQINDLQREIARLRALQQEQEDAHGNDLDAMLAEQQRLLDALNAQAQPVIARGFVTDVVAPEDLQVAPGPAIADYLDADWIAHITMIPTQDAAGEHGLTKDEISKADKFKPRTPVMGKPETPANDQTISADDASQYVSGSASGGSEGGSEFVMRVEFWDATSGSVLTGIKGVCKWVKPAWQPPATERFFPFFGFPLSEVDGQRHPQSLVSRSAKLLDEYNRIGTAEREHRKRCMPQIAFDEGAIDPDNAKKLCGGVAGELIGVNLNAANKTLSEVMWQKPYPTVDQALYDRTRVNYEIDAIWGVQEALSGSVQTEKTATEAEIQQTGFNARNGGRRDILETMLGELAQYTAEVARANVTREDAQAIAGPDAYWPEYAGAEDLRSFVNVDIRAGTSGKPNTSADRAAWAALYPTLSATVQQVAQLRMSSPLDVADSLIELARLTAQRSGDDRIDINQLMPKPGPMPAPTAITGGGEDGQGSGGQPGGGEPAGNEAGAGGPAGITAAA